MLKFSEIFEFSRENSYFERIRMVRMVRMVRSLADRTFQLWYSDFVIDCHLNDDAKCKLADCDTMYITSQVKE